MKTIISLLILCCLGCNERLPPSVKVCQKVINTDTVYTILWVRGDGKNIIDSEYFSINDFSNDWHKAAWFFARDTTVFKHLAYKYFNQ